MEMDLLNELYSARPVQDPVLLPLANVQITAIESCLTIRPFILAISVLMSEYFSDTDVVLSHLARVGFSRVYPCLDVYSFCMFWFAPVSTRFEASYGIKVLCHCKEHPLDMHTLAHCEPYLTLLCTDQPCPSSTAYAAEPTTQSDTASPRSPNAVQPPRPISNIFPGMNLYSGALLD